MYSSIGKAQTGPSATGISLVEILVVVGLSGLLAVMAISLVVQQPTDAWNKVTEDYIRHLATVYYKTRLERGNTPVLAKNADGTRVYAHGMGSVLADWESVATYTDTAPSRLQYPSKIMVYTRPEQSQVPDPGAGGERIPRHQTGALTPDNPVTDASPKTVMAGTDDREWLLLDMNGATGPNNLGVNGDRTLIIVDDATGRVMTAWQKCKEFNGQTGYTVGLTATTCTISSPAPSRVYYKSRYDQFKNY